jgi:hypothetical protein
MPIAGPDQRSDAVVEKETVEALWPSVESFRVSFDKCSGIYVTDVTYVGIFFYVGLHMKLCTSCIDIPPTSFPVDGSMRTS